MYEQATSIPAPSGILLEADYNWKHTQKTQSTIRRFFGRSYMAPTPSIITTIQQIGIVYRTRLQLLTLESNQKL
jgi:hypothetical protein